MIREKITRQYGTEYWIISETGYIDELGEFINHSFEEHESSKLYKDGSKFWHDNGIRYWFINNQRYNTFNEIYEKYNDKIIEIKVTLQELTDDNIDFIQIDEWWDNKIILILDDTDRNEVILKYG